MPAKYFFATLTMSPSDVVKDSMPIWDIKTGISTHWTYFLNNRAGVV
jgi:hypothetical protein